jgi:hypothetical protein
VLTLPNVDFVMTSHTGHWMQWERAELFNCLVTQFLPRLGMTSRPAHDQRLGQRPPGLRRHRDHPLRGLRRFGRDAIGMHLDDVAHDALRFRSTTTNAGSCCGTVRPRTSSPSAGSSTTTAPSTKSSRA